MVAVDQITPVPIQYQYGPSWRLSAADKHEFQQLVTKSRESSRLSGWYRSNTRPEHEPEEADRQISQMFFGGAQSIFLFCQPSADGQIHANCIIMFPRRVEVAFAFELGKFSRIEALFHARHDADTPPVLAPPLSTSRPIAGAPPILRAARPPLISRNLVAATAAVAMVGAMWYARAHAFTAATARVDAASAAPAPFSPPAPATGLLLGLHADYQKDSLLIGWNRTALEVASAASATFRIADGARTRTLNLTARELQNGSIVYKPNADEISIELSVTSREGAAASQSILIVGATLQSNSPANTAPHTVIQESGSPSRHGHFSLRRARTQRNGVRSRYRMPRQWTPAPPDTRPSSLRAVCLRSRRRCPDSQKRGASFALRSPSTLRSQSCLQACVFPSTLTTGLSGFRWK